MIVGIIALAPALVDRGILTGCEVTPIEPAEVVAAREVSSMGGGCQNAARSQNARCIHKDFK